MNKPNDVDEFAMVAALCCREEDAKLLKKIYDPNWLAEVELQPILRAIFNYMDEFEVSPSVDSLGQYMEMKDKAKFDARWKTSIEQLRSYESKTKLQILNVAMAKKTAATTSFSTLLQEQRMQDIIEGHNADALKAEVSKWMHAHTESEEEEVMSINEAYDGLLDSFPFAGRAPKIATGIRPIDEWSGGLRPPQLGIIMAPSGHGKSALLMNMARYAASIEDKTVLMVTNELTTNEQTERFLVRMQDPQPGADGKQAFVTLDKIQDDPTTAYKKLDGYQKELDKHLYIYSATLGQDVSGLEEVMRRLRIERGAWPELVVVDYIERMSTKVRMDRGATWSYYGQVAKELVWLAKRRNCAIWTAIQTNRGGLNAKVSMGMEYAQGSIQHLQEASIVLGARRVAVSAGAGVTKHGMEFTEMKSRHGAMEGRTMTVEVDLARMYISDVELVNVEIEDTNLADAASTPKKPIKSQYATRKGQS